MRGWPRQRFITYSENNNKHSSIVTKRQLLNDHLVPAFGSMALDAISPAEIEDFKAAMRKKPSGARARKEAPTRAAPRKRKGTGPKLLSLRSINNVLTVLHKLLALTQVQAESLEEGTPGHLPPRSLRIAL